MEALERRGKALAIAAILYIVFWSQCKGVEGLWNSTKMSYVCPPQFIRLGHSCYYFSDTAATWQNALFACKDRDSNLTVPARWEDRNLRQYLNKPEVEKVDRWIGGIYDSYARAWKWGGELRPMRYQSFSKMKKLKPDDLKFHCIAMVPELDYRWEPKKCHQTRQYICQTKLRKIRGTALKEYKNRYERKGRKINEIAAPSLSRELNDPSINDVRKNAVQNPKAFDVRPSDLRQRPKFHRGYPNRLPGVRPNELRKRSRPPTRPTGKLTIQFPGFKWDRRDPEGSYRRNAELLNSGKTGLSPQQVRSQLARLQHHRKKEIARRNRARNGRQRKTMLNTLAKTYTVDNNISALHPKVIVEEFEMMPPPPPVAVVRSVRGAG